MRLVGIVPHCVALCDAARTRKIGVASRHQTPPDGLGRFATTGNYNTYPRSGCGPSPDLQI
jgi:hypothetical protein